MQIGNNQDLYNQISIPFSNTKGTHTHTYTHTHTHTHTEDVHETYAIIDLYMRAAEFLV